MYYSYKHLTPSSFWTVSSLSKISTTSVSVPNNKIEKVKPNISNTLFLNLHLLLYTAPFCSCYASSVPLTSLALPVLHNLSPNVYGFLLLLLRIFPTIDKSCFDCCSPTEVQNCCPKALFLTGMS